jgi:hypothetical protein
VKTFKNGCGDGLNTLGGFFYLILHLVLQNGKKFTCSTIFSKHYHSLGQQVEKSWIVAIILFFYFLKFHQLLMCDYEHLLQKKKKKIELNILCETNTI